MAKAKEVEGLDCGAEAGAGVRLVLRTRVEELCGWRAAALDWSDPEGVHDMRVASRRLRSAVRDFSPYLRKRRFRHAREALKGLADSLGLVRDEDVAIMALEKLATEAPSEVAAGVGQFVAERKLRRERARARLERALTEEALSELREDFDDALAGGVKSDDTVSFRRAGREIIRAGVAELRELSANLYSPLKSEPLHRLRIAAKRLRYAVELFAACWGEDALAPCAKEIAKIQTSLGELHDCDVWIDELGGRLSRTEREDAAEMRSAAFWLLDYFVRERTGQFQDTLARWREWEADAFLSRLSESLTDD